MIAIFGSGGILLQKLNQHLSSKNISMTSLITQPFAESADLYMQTVQPRGG